MSLSIFDLFIKLLDLAWSLLSGIAGLSMRFFGALFQLGLKAVGAVFHLLMAPFTWSLDHLWDWSALDLWGVFAMVMWVLLIACALLAVFAVGSNVCRKLRHRIK